MDAVQDHASLSSRLLEKLEQNYWNAAKFGFPLFPKDIESSSLLNASPYVISYGNFIRNPPDREISRPDLLTSFSELISALKTARIIPIAAIIGGSYLRSENEPKDLDCVIFYSKSEDSAPLSSLQRLQGQFNSRGIDVRLVPLDTSPTLALKAAIFFGCLYSIDRASGASPHGCVLIEFEG